MTHTHAFRNRGWGKRGLGANCAAAGGAARPCWGFSLLELLVVLVVTVLLTGLLMPAMVHVRENAWRVICSSNLRQIGMGVNTFADENNDRLPHSFFGERGQNKQNMMAAHLGAGAFDTDTLGGAAISGSEGMAYQSWEGLGWLYRWGHVNSADVFYCPSHVGEHPYDRYQDLYPRYRRVDVIATTPIYTNYQYAGDKDWANDDQPERRRRLTDENLIIATDGLRTVLDFNHVVGMNVLRGDSSVTWREDQSTHEVRDLLPTSTASTDDETDPDYNDIWGLIEDPVND
ncbi:MAG: DUF1559 domain-containing protein [Phycisphaerales bacterium]